MLLNSKNRIDNKIKKTFSEKIIENVTLDNLDYFGINISSDPKQDFDFKIYYRNKYSRELYSASSTKIPIVDFLLENKLGNFLTIVHDKKHTDCSRYDVGLGTRSNGNMGAVVSYLERNCIFFEKYREEILNLAQMKCYEKENMDYSAFYFVALLNSGGNEILKCHWQNRVYDFETEFFKNEYFLDYLENSNIEGFKPILPLAKKIIKNCNANMFMEGIDYSNDSPSKHKIYLTDSRKPYKGLIGTYKNVPQMQKRITTIKNWNNIHKELYCDCFAIGQDSNKNLTINFYFRCKRKRG